MARARGQMRVIGGTVTAEQYQAIKAALDAAGFRSVSVGVRTVLLAYAVAQTIKAPEAEEAKA